MASAKPDATPIPVVFDDRLSTEIDTIVGSGAYRSVEDFMRKAARREVSAWRESHKSGKNKRD